MATVDPGLVRGGRGPDQVCPVQSLALSQGSAKFFYKGPGSKYLGFAAHRDLHHILFFVSVLFYNPLKIYFKKILSSEA